MCQTSRGLVGSHSFIYSFIQSASQPPNIYLTIILCLVLGVGSDFKELIDLDKVIILIPVHVYFQFS